MCPRPCGVVYPKNIGPKYLPVGTAFSSFQSDVFFLLESPRTFFPPSWISSTLTYVGTIYISQNILEYQHLGTNIRKVRDTFIISCFGTKYLGIWAIYFDIVNMIKLSL